MNINQNSDPITGDSEDIEDLDDIDIEAPETDIPDIATGEDKRLKRFFRGVKNLITGRNKAGEKIGYGLDLVGVFVPPVDKIRSSVKGIFNINQSQRNLSTMDKPKLLSKTVWSAIMIALTALLQAFGVDLTADPELTVHIYETIYGLAGAFGLYGLRDAVSKQIEKS